jgi:hypothetical protein
MANFFVYVLIMKSFREVLKLKVRQLSLSARLQVASHPQRNTILLRRISRQSRSLTISYPLPEQRVTSALEN